MHKTFTELQDTVEILQENDENRSSVEKQEFSNLQISNIKNSRSQLSSFMVMITTMILEILGANFYSR